MLWKCLELCRGEGLCIEKWFGCWGCCLRRAAAAAEIPEGELVLCFGEREDPVLGGLLI